MTEVPLLTIAYGAAFLTFWIALNECVALVQSLAFNADVPADLRPTLYRRFLKISLGSTGLGAMLLLASYTSAVKFKSELQQARSGRTGGVLISNPESVATATLVSVVTSDGNLIEGDSLEWSMRLFSADSGTEIGCVSGTGGRERHRTAIHALPGIGGAGGSVRGLDSVSDVPPESRRSGTYAIPAFVERFRDIVTGRQAEIRGVAGTSKGMKEL